MIFPLLRLELRQNVLSAASVAIAFFITLPIARLVSAATGLETAKALEAILSAWILIGLPLAAALIGASAGARAASSSAREREALLPVSPARRAGVSLGAAALLFLMCALLVFGTARLSISGLFTYEHGPLSNWGSDFWEGIPTSPLLHFAALDILFGSWLLAYLIGHGLAGGLLGLLLSLSTAAAIVCGYGLEMIYRESWNVSPFIPHAVSLAGFAVLAKLAVVFPNVSRRERGMRLRPLLFIPSLLAGPVVSWSLVGHVYTGLIQNFQDAEPSTAFTYQSLSEDAEASPASLAAQGKEILFHTARGGVLLASKDGLHPLIEEERAGLLDLLSGPYNILHLNNSFRDENGRLWFERYSLFYLEIWRVDSQKATRLWRSDGLYWLRIARLARRLLITRPGVGPKGPSYSLLDQYIRLGKKAPIITDIAAALDDGRKSPLLARIDCKGTCLRRKDGKSWRLPGKALSRESAFPHWAGGRPAYLIPYQRSNGKDAAALCLENGRVETIWSLRSTKTDFNNRFYALPDGTLYAYEPGDSIGIVDADGRFAGSLNFSPHRGKRKGQPDLVYRDGGSSWLVWDDDLLKIGPDGSMKAVHRLPGPRYDIRTMRDGVIVNTHSGLHFVDWTGKARRLGRLGV